MPLDVPSHRARYATPPAGPQQGWARVGVAVGKSLRVNCARHLAGAQMIWCKVVLLFLALAGGAAWTSTATASSELPFLASERRANSAPTQELTGEGPVRIAFAKHLVGVFPSRSLRPRALLTEHGAGRVRFLCGVLSVHALIF